MQRWDYLVIHHEWNAPSPNTFGYSFEPSWYWSDDKTSTLTDEERLRQLGLQGWELVSAYPVALADAEGWASGTSSVIYVFKRPISGE
jgi:hypothetical protein